jgi:hypothetical protein
VGGRRGAGLRAAGIAAVAWAAASCNQIDTTPLKQQNATLGDDLYGVVCDRVGASSFPEDLSGASYHAICHFDAKAHYGSKVDLAALPPPTSAAEKDARRLSVAKLERMAARRDDLIHALNAVFCPDVKDVKCSDVKIPDITSKKAGAEIRFHDALFTFLQDLTPLYETNPLDKSKGATPLLPSQTRSLARLFDSFASPGQCAGGTKKCDYDQDCGKGNTCVSPVRDALSHMWGRRGYRPFQVGLGVVRPALAYPDLRTLTKTAISLLGPGGSASNELQQVLTVLKQELVTATPTVSPLPNLVIDAATAQPNRPRSDIEFASALFLTQNDLFAGSPADPPRYIALRDRRGFVVPAGNKPGVKGTVPAPFSDLDGDGFADVDPFGRFIDSGGAPVAVELPFAVPEITDPAIPLDQFGRPTKSATQFAYLDSGRTVVGGLAHHLIPLVDPTVLAQGDPNAYQKEHETLMYALGGAYLLFGGREQATYDYAAEGPKGGKVTYSRFRADDSPLPDLIHAAGQILADKDSDALLLSLLDLFQNHQQTVARLMGAALRIREISLQHDMLAAQNKEAKAELAYEVPIWDEMAVVLGGITRRPGLLQALLVAMANDVVVTPVANAQHMGDAMSKFAMYKDQLRYNPSGKHYDGSQGGINGPAVNLTIDPNGSDTSDPRTPVDNSAPKTGKNMSCLQRSLQLIHDANGGPACNKDGATVAAKLGPISVNWPIFGSPYGECGLFKFDNLANFYLDSLLPANHPKRAFLKILASDLNGLLSFLGTVGANIDNLLQESSDITGLTQHPEPYALNRLVFFGASSSNYPGMPDQDFVNQGKQVDDFVSGSIEPISAAWCPPDAANKVPTCSAKSGTLRVRDPNTIFLWERFGFTNYLAPVVQALAEAQCEQGAPTCVQGEQVFGDLIEVLNRHWPAPDHGPECSKTDKTIYCSEAGVNHYEPILSEAFVSDIIPALHEFAKVATQLSKITVQRGPNKGQTWTGAQVLEKMTQILFDPKYAASVKMTDRKGNAGTTWVDGTPQAQVTGFSLFADALHKIDTRFATACDCAGKVGKDQADCMANFNACRADAQIRQGQWKRARSQLVDEFLAVDGTGTSAKFHNPTIPPTVIALLQTLREQLNANCPNRETSGSCAWARTELGKKFADMLGRPLFAALSDMQEKLRADEPSRRELETFLQYVLAGTADDGQALQGVLASITDLLQVLQADGDLSPVLAAASDGASPSADPQGPGAADTGIKVLKVLTDDKYDRYHVMDYVLPKLVTPMDDGSNLSPIEIIMDVISDVNRIDAASPDPLRADDYQGIVSTMHGFMSDKTRGIEQLYTIIQSRPKQ